MIKKGISIEKSEDVTVAVFGKGDIGVAYGVLKESPSVQTLILFNTGEENVIGSEIDGTDGKSTADIQMDLIFHFDNPDSVEVVIDALKVIHRKLTNAWLCA